MSFWRWNNHPSRHLQIAKTGPDTLTKDFESSEVGNPKIH